MELQLANDNTIINYAKIGSFDNSIYISENELPENFTEDFVKGYFIYDYSSKSIIINENYKPDLPTPDFPQERPNLDISDVDISQIKKMVSTLQKQGVKNNLIISNILKKNKELKNKIVNLESNQGGGVDGTE